MIARVGGEQVWTAPEDVDDAEVLGVTDGVQVFDVPGDLDEALQYQSGHAAFDTPPELGDVAPAITGYDLWFSAADLDTITAASNLVSAWANKGSAGGSAVQATGSLQPSSGLSTINGRNVIDCVDGTTIMNLTGLSLTGGTRTTYTVFQIASASDFKTVWRYREGASGIYLISRTATDQMQEFDEPSFGELNVSAPSLLGTLYDVILVGNGAGNDSLSVNNGTPATANRQNIGTIDTFQIGSAAACAIMRLCEIVSYPTIHSSGDRAATHAGLVSKWAIP